MHAIFVMIKCDLGKTYDVANHIVENIAETSEVYSVSGQWDLLGKFYLKDVNDIGRFICDDLQTTPGIRDTFTIDTFNAFSA
ncbi:MAG: Lrp/AsnC ligand binding domain-containing protein [Acidobacteria bacterium]|nr:Lrp/AsnC ligand binding domain-containing protein [Acidobacteriota bacterium]